MHAWSLPGSPCPSIAPRVKSLASVVKINSFDKSGARNTGSLQRLLAVFQKPAVVFHPT